MDNLNENYNKEKGGIQNFVPFPRKLASDRRNGIITRDEFDVCVWLRLCANPYGISVTSLSGLSEDVFKTTNKINYTNKLILSLKKKRYLYYDDRTGRRGTFEVHFPDFMLQNKKITSLDKFYKTTEVRGETTTGVPSLSEPVQNSSSVSQNLNDLKSDINSLSNIFSVNKPVRGCNNDKDNYKDNDLSTSLKKGSSLSEFKPRNSEEEYCLMLATKLGENDIAFMLSALKKYGRETLEKTWRVFQEEEKTTKINSKGSYFNALVKRIYAQEF